MKPNFFQTDSMNQNHTQDLAEICVSFFNEILFTELLAEKCLNFKRTLLKYKNSWQPPPPTFSEFATSLTNIQNFSLIKLFNLELKYRNRRLGNKLLRRQRQQQPHKQLPSPKNNGLPEYVCKIAFYTNKKYLWPKKKEGKMEKI